MSRCIICIKSAHRLNFFPSCSGKMPERGLAQIKEGLPDLSNPSSAFMAGSTRGDLATSGLTGLQFTDFLF